MKSILVALDNNIILEKIKKTGKYYTNQVEVTYQQGTLEYLSRNQVDIIITKDDIEGEMTKEIYIKQIKLISPKIKIILFVEDLSETYKGFLLANGVSNIIEKKEVGFSEIFELIEEQDKHIISDKLTGEEGRRLIRNEVNVVSKQLICVFGTSGSGKSYISSVIAQLLSKKIKLNTLLVDMDSIGSATDIYNNLNNSGGTLSCLMEEIDNKTFESGELIKMVTRVKNNPHISFITNNLTLYDSQNRFSREYYESLYRTATNKYDITLVDLPACPFFDVVMHTIKRSNKLIFVLNPNFISLRQALKYLDLIISIWKFSREDIYIVINKQRKESLSLKQIQSVLSGYKILMIVAESVDIENTVNGYQELSMKNIKMIEDARDFIGVNVLEREPFSITQKISEIIGGKIDN